MSTRSPFSFLGNFPGASGASRADFGFPNPPGWVIDETQQNVLLLVNHVLMQEPEAMRRLAQVKGRTLLLRWGRFSMGLAVTPAGLFDRVLEGPADGVVGLPSSTPGPPDLTLTLAQDSPWALAQAALRGERPPLRIEGDVQFASEINWLVDHVRWDVEEDLSRLIGDAPARALGALAQRAVRALREFVPGAASAGGAVDPLARR